jgi:hypothetical protein
MLFVMKQLAPPSLCSSEVVMVMNKDDDAASSQ